MVRFGLFVALSLFLLLVLVTGQQGNDEESTKTCLADGTCTENPVVATEETNATVESTKEPDCADNNDSCAFWAKAGECEANPDYMLKFCQKSCDSCGMMDEEETPYASEEERKLNEEMQNLERNEHGVVQDVPDGYEKDIERALNEMTDYIDDIRANGSPDMVKVLDICENKNPNCALWAVLGECQKNPPYMKMQCPRVCKTCDQLSVTTRCPLDPNAPNAWQPGSLDEMFVNVTTLPEFQKYEPVVLSRPDYLEGDTEDNADYQIGPWVVVLENFLSEEETLRLIELGAEEGYVRSADVGKLKADGSFEHSVNNGRTSTNAWCQHSCYRDPTAQAVMDRIANLTNTPEVNSEYLQLLRYEVGQFYQRHHDYIEHQTYRQQGPRLLTVFLYLNDVEAGGGTNFPLLDLTVMPRRGRALLWPSVKNENPDFRDPRTDHQALPVEKGLKYGANAWIHQRDFKGPNGAGCQ